MKLIKFRMNDRNSYGIATADGIIDLQECGHHFESGRDVVALTRRDDLLHTSSGRQPHFKFDEIVYEPFLPDPEKIFCVGVNYTNRNEEYRDDSALPKFPSLFIRTPDSFVGHNGSIVRPIESDKLDYEGEIAIIIGKSGRRIPEDTAEQHIAGLTLMNEGTIRDWIRHAKFNVTQGKNFERSGAIGPWLVTADEFENFDSLDLETRINDEVRQKDSTVNLMFPFRYLISYISTFTTLKPGDVIATGTPPGAGARFDPPKYLQPGDTVEVASPQIGSLRVDVVAEE